MKVINFIQRHCFSGLVVFTNVVVITLLTACGPQEQPTPTPTLQPVAIATATRLPTPTPPPPTDTPEPPTVTPTATGTATPTPAPTEPPAPAATPTSPPTATPVPLLQVQEAKVIYHDAVDMDGVGKYKQGVSIWIDLLVRLDGNWYGPERQADDINALPLPDGYRWEVDGDFSSLPNGEAWWTGPGIEGEARLIDPEGSEIHSLELKIEFE